MTESRIKISPIWTGAIFGALVGFLVRPSIPLVGQLPLLVVVTRGAFLSGLDILLRPTAEQSFNWMLGGAIVGSVVLGAFTGVLHKSRPAGVPLPRNVEPTTGMPASSCAKCGREFVSGAKFCSRCGGLRISEG